MSPDPAEVVRRWLLTHPTPPDQPPETTIRLQADGIIDALVEAGCLPTAQAQVEDAAQWLADQIRHPRYAGEGWRLLLTSEVDLSIALRKAEAEPGIGRRMVEDARTVLRHHLERTTTKRDTP